jgi:outer membrane receptor protein involved in Fe transport
VRTVGDYYLDQGNANIQDSFSIVNAVVGYKNGNFDISVFGRNIFDKRYVVSVYDFKGTSIGGYGALADRATFGVRSRLTF